MSVISSPFFSCVSSRESHSNRVDMMEKDATQEKIMSRSTVETVLLPIRRYRHRRPGRLPDPSPITAWSRLARAGHDDLPRCWVWIAGVRWKPSRRSAVLVGDTSVSTCPTTFARLLLPNEMYRTWVHAQRVRATLRLLLSTWADDPNGRAHASFSDLIFLVQLAWDAQLLDWVDRLDSWALDAQLRALDTQLWSLEEPADPASTAAADSLSLPWEWFHVSL